MKKQLFSAIALLALLCGSLNAQPQAKRGEISDVAPQGSYTPSFANDGKNKAPLNVILMIGDGMGLSHVTAAMYANGGELTLTNLRTCGYSRTQSATDFTTDSAASGTAYATGQKTYNGSIGLDVNKDKVQNIPEKVADKGVICGVVTTDKIDGATPAAFFAHQANRNMSDEIWGDLSYSKLSFIAGGTKEDFENQSYETQDAINKRFTVVDRLSDHNLAAAKRIAYLPSKDDLVYKSKGRGNFLPEATQYAIDFLSSNASKNKGFFLMVEGAQIDKAAHGNDFASVIQEVLDFDKAIEAAIRFAEKDGNTLVIITADHETGALTLGNGKPAEGYMSGTFVSTNHTASPVPLFAYGPMSQIFMGFQENSDVSNKIVQILSGK